MDYVLGRVNFGVLLPVTSRGLRDPEDCIRNLRNFAKSLKDTTREDTSLPSLKRFLNPFLFLDVYLNRSLNPSLFRDVYQRFELKVYVGVDESDYFLSRSWRVEKILKEQGIENVETMVFTYPPGSICAIWRDLGRRAYEDQSYYTVLLGDDVVLSTPGWMSRFHKAFGELESIRGVPRGFGCVAFSDKYFPGFPTFPVMGRTHFDIFGGEVIPNSFINQDGNPYLFHLYRRWGCSMMLQDVFVENTMGGSKEARYRKKHHRDWTFNVLDDGSAKVRKWLTEQQSRPQGLPLEYLTLDVVVPTFRVPLEGLEKIINLKRSKTCSTMIIIIVDNPLSPNIPALKKKYEHHAYIRIRVNATNCGASEARNRGLAESAADYVLFLDDDIIPDPEILLESEKVIRRYPKACGFVGQTKFPDPTSNVVSSAVVLSGVTFFWGITKQMREDMIPWGVTANLLIIRRINDDVSFDPRFPKSGGGEHVDFCLRKQKAHMELVDGGGGFRGAPKVIVTHPWWNNGRRSFNYFRGWGIGDGALVKMYPHLSYHGGAPNSAETFLIAIILCAVAAAIYLASLFVGDTRFIQFVYLLVYLLPLSVPEVVIANVLYDIQRHVCIDNDNNLPELRGFRRTLAVGESTVVRMVSEWGRLEGMIRRGEWSCIGQRFDWFAGRLGEVPLNIERQHTLGQFNLWLQLLILTLVYGAICL